MGGEFPHRPASLLKLDCPVAFSIVCSLLRMLMRTMSSKRQYAII